MGKVVKLIARNHQFIGVNKAIENIRHKEEKIIDLSGLDFELLEQYFLKTKKQKCSGSISDRQS